MLCDVLELLNDQPEVRTVVGRLPECLELLEGRFNALENDGHFTAELAGRLFDRLPQRIEGLRRIAGVIAVLGSEYVALLAHAYAPIVRSRDRGGETNCAPSPVRGFHSAVDGEYQDPA